MRVLLTQDLSPETSLVAVQKLQSAGLFPFSWNLPRRLKFFHTSLMTFIFRGVSQGILVSFRAVSESVRVGPALRLCSCARPKGELSLEGGGRSQIMNTPFNSPSIAGPTVPHLQNFQASLLYPGPGLLGEDPFSASIRILASAAIDSICSVSSPG